MESISQLVDRSLARNGVEASVDHLRLRWSPWFRCESSFSVLLAPAKPGLFALGEEVVPSVDGDKRMLALFQISETDDLGMALGRLFLPGNPLRERLAAGHCFARYTVVEDADQRQTASRIFQRWMQESAETAAGISPSGAGVPARESEGRESGPSISLAWGMEAPNRDLAERVRRQVPFPSGF